MYHTKRLGTSKIADRTQETEKEKKLPFQGTLSWICAFAHACVGAIACSLTLVPVGHLPIRRSRDPAIR